MNETVQRLININHKTERLYILCFLTEFNAYAYCYFVQKVLFTLLLKLTFFKLSVVLKILLCIVCVNIVKH